MKIDTATLEQDLQAYTQVVADQVMKTNFALLAEIIEVMIQAKFKGKKIFTAGNGGSGSTASHMANDFLKGCRAHNREGFNIESLADSSAIITCLANDFAYEDSYSIQVRTKGTRGDVLVVFSGSGNSPNIVKAVEAANEMGMITIGFSGRDGGRIRQLCQYILLAPTDCMEQLEDMHMIYEHAMATMTRQTLEDLWGMEIVRYPRHPGKIKAALFDFDGTVSLIREGWQDIMIPYFIEVLSETPGAEESKELQQCVRDFVDRLTGKQTVFQCIRLDEEVIKRGGSHRDPMEYKAEYLRRLGLHIAHRHADLKAGADPEQYLVPGISDLLKALQAQGIKCYLASGTDHENVLEEAQLLKIRELFDGGIWGALDTQASNCTKTQAIKRIIEENKIDPTELVSFGDGYVEIELVAGLGGYTFGVATDEVRRKGINAWKRRRLLEAGADAIIPDFACPESILRFITEGVR